MLLLSLGELIRRLRREHDWTQTDLGHRCHLHQQDISALELNEFAGVVPFEALAQAFEVPIAILHQAAMAAHCENPSRQMDGAHAS